MSPNTTDRRIPDPARPIARVLGCTRGQVYTVAIGLILAFLLAALGIPPTLRDRTDARRGTTGFAPDTSTTRSTRIGTGIAPLDPSASTVASGTERTRASGPPARPVKPAVGPLISGQSSYVNGTFVWTDYAYDDRGPDTNDRPGGDATYPADMQPNNVADLIQLQMRPAGNGLAATVVLETLTAKTRPVVGIAFDSDGKRSTGAASLPGSWKAAAPLGVDTLFILGVDEGRVRSAPDGRWKDGKRFSVAVDAEDNSLSAVLPFSLPAGGKLRAVAAVGYADGAGRSWIDGATPVHDLAFVKAEKHTIPYLQSVTDAVTNFAAGGDTVWQDYRQSAILGAKADPARAIASIDVAALRSGRTKLATPDTKGFHTFLYRSALRLGEGVQGNGNAALFAGPFQPYLVWVPENVRPGLPLVMYMHGSSQTHLSAVNSAHYDPSTRDPVANLPEAFFDFDAVVAWPLGRGPEQGYTGSSEQDVIDVTDDVLSRLELDRERVMLAGLSMGGIGTFRLGQLYPDRWSVAYADVGIDDTQLLENLTSLPLRLQNGGADYLVNVGLALETRTRVDAAGTVDYKSWLRYNNHHQPAVAQAECVYRESFTRPRVRNPARVRYTVDPAMFVNDPKTGLHLRYDGAYWVDEMRPAGSGRASVDLTTLAFGRVPVPGATTRAVYENTTAGRDFCGPNPKVQTRASWDEQARAVKLVTRKAQPVVSGTLSGLSTVTVAADRAGVARPGGRLELTADRPATLMLTGLPRGSRVTAGKVTTTVQADGVAKVRLAAGKNVVMIGSQSL